MLILWIRCQNIGRRGFPAIVGAIRFYTVLIYTGEDLKPHPFGVSFQIITDKDAARPTVGAYAPYRAIGELKCPILILQWCKSFYRNHSN